MIPMCPRCDSRDLASSSETLYASDETITATHECQQCHTRFRVVPPPEPFNPVRMRAAG